MANLKDIRRRIGSVQKTQQITRAMRMVAAAKLRRAQDAISAARPYADRMRKTLEEVAGAQGDTPEPLMTAHESVRRIEVLVVTSDRGLCGAFNSNVLKMALAEITARRGQSLEVSVTSVGSKAVDFFRRRGIELTKTQGGYPRVEYAQAKELADHLAKRFVGGEIDEAWLVNSVFVTTMTQQPRLVRLLPVAPDAGESDTGERESLPYTLEPDAETLLRVLAPKALETEIFRALLDNQAGEHAARMTAMESATRNSEEMISRLTLQYNRARQAAITRELVEIVSGAEAL